MAEIKIEMYGLEETQKMLVELPENLNKEIDSVQGNFMSFVQKSAKLRAPRFSGQLADSIVFKKNNRNNWQLSVLSPYGWFQEHGFTGKFLPGSMPVMGGYRIADWMAAMGLNGFGFRPSGIPHPFVEPALESGLNRLPNMLQDATYNAIRRSK
jgi:hypothetical protein